MDISVCIYSESYFLTKDLLAEYLRIVGFQKETENLTSIVAASVFVD